MKNLLFNQRSGVESKLCFILMPFTAELTNVYDAITSSIGSYCGLTCVKADEISHSGRITEDIWNKINQARFLVADLTGRNTNVFYELGLAHALGKRVILITQNEHDVPFDLKDLRYIRYQADDLNHLRAELIKYAKACISTIPENWNRSFCPSNWDGGYIKILDVKATPIISEGESFEIYVKARNNGTDVRQGYFSVSFPGGAEGITIETSNAPTKIGAKGDFWTIQDHILEYPIAEGFKCDNLNEMWRAGRTCHITVRGYAKRKGLCWFYLNASCEGKADVKWIWDPFEPLLDVDQRDENVYCGVIEVVEQTPN